MSLHFISPLLLGVPLLLSRAICNAQDAAELPRSAPIAVFAELGGGSCGFTVNVEKTMVEFRPGRYLNVRVGGATYPIGDGRFRFVSIPVGASIHYGIRNWHPEIGVTAAFVQAYGYSEYPVKRVSSSLFITPGVGYRFQKPGNSFFLKLQYTPIIKVKEYTEGRMFKGDLYDPVHFGAICIGYSFVPRLKK